MPATQPLRMDLLRLIVRDEGRGASDESGSPDLSSLVPCPSSLFSIGPNRRLFMAAMGRGPIVKTSRKIPPTPVAAPWNGSIKLGWLCDSTLNATHQSSPTSI